MVHFNDFLFSVRPISSYVEFEDHIYAILPHAAAADINKPRSSLSVALNMKRKRCAVTSGEDCSLEPTSLGCEQPEANETLETESCCDWNRVNSMETLTSADAANSTKR